MVLPLGGPDFVARYRTRDLAGLGPEVTVLTHWENPGVPGAPGTKSKSARRQPWPRDHWRVNWSFSYLPWGGFTPLPNIPIIAVMF